jgi:hypothetical protein
MRSKAYYFIITLLFSVLAPPFLRAQEQQQVTAIKDVNSDSPVIRVSETMFDAIENWLAPEYAEIPLDKYLLEEGLPEKDVQFFKEQHLAGLNQQSSAKYKSGGAQSGGCACNTIIPDGSIRTFNAPEGEDYEWRDKEYEGFLDGKWWRTGKAYYNHGLSTDFWLRAMSEDMLSTIAGNQMGSARARFMNLCSSDEYLRDDLCNCDKIINYEGEYRNNIQANLDAKMQTMFPSKSRYYFRANYLLGKAEHNPGGLANAAKHELIDSARFEASGEQQWSVDYSKIGGALTNAISAYNYLIDTSKVGYPADDLGQFVSNLFTAFKYSSSGSNITEDYIRPFIGSDTLKANVPLYFIGAHSYSGVTETSGRPRNNAQVRYRSAFYWTFEIENSDQGYDIQGNPVGRFSRCCNEDFALWDLHNRVGTIDLGFQQMANRMQQAIKKKSNGYPFRWDANTDGVTMPNQFITHLNDEPYFLTSQMGSAYTIGNCGCESLQEQIVDPETGEVYNTILIPKISVEPQSLCLGETPTLTIHNADRLPKELCDRMEVIVKLEGHGVIFSQFAASITGSINLSLPFAGTYTIIFKDGCTACVTTASIEVFDCGPDAQAQCIWNNLISFPVPISTHDEYLNLRTCLNSCLDNSTDSSSIFNLHAQFFPATATLFDMNSNIVVPTKSVLTTSTYNSSNRCFEDFLDLRNAIPSHPLPAGTYVLRVILANGDTFTRPILIN